MSGAGVSALQELRSHGHRIPISRPKCCKGASFSSQGIATLSTASDALLSTGHAARTDVV